MTHPTSLPSTKTPSPPPRWFVRAFWIGQRAVYSLTRGRIGLRRATPARWGMLRLRTVGLRTGLERSAILGFVEDGPDLVTMAMNGWADPEPAWWLNLQAHPDAMVDLPDGPRAVRARAADPDERPRLWAMWAAYGDDLDGYAALRSRETAVVILSPRPEVAAFARTGPPPGSACCTSSERSASFGTSCSEARRRWSSPSPPPSGGSC